MLQSATWRNSPGIGASSISSAHDPSAAFSQSSVVPGASRRRRGRTLISQEVSQGHLLLFLLLGRCKKLPLAICVSSVVAVQSGAKKSRLASDSRTLRSPRRLTHDCGLADYARKDFFRALSGSSAKSVFYSGSGLFFWLRGCVRSFVCGVSSSFPNGNLKLCVRWASLMSSEIPVPLASMQRNRACPI